MVCLSATNVHVCSFNSKNENSWYEDYDKLSYCYKMEIISGDVYLRICVGGLNRLQKYRKEKGSFQSFF